MGFEDIIFPPPSIEDRLPEGYLARFVVEIVGLLELSSLKECFMFSRVLLFDDLKNHAGFRRRRIFHTTDRLFFFLLFKA